MRLDDVLVLDGGLSNALEDRGLDLSSGLWTARLLLDDPAQVAAVHRDYYLAGADVATTASYQASVPSLVAAGLSRREAERTTAGSVELAREVRDEVGSASGRRLLVAASVGPYGAVLAVETIPDAEEAELLVPLLAYPNRGESWDSATHTWSGDAAFDTSLVAGWVTAGARLVGGCCRVGPRDIAELAGVLDR